MYFIQIPLRILAREIYSILPNRLNCKMLGPKNEILVVVVVVVVVVVI
jgi:hypothetical protein